MSGWFYMKEGWLGDKTEGPFNDAAFLRLAFDGDLGPKAKVLHPSHTANQWAFLDQIPAAVKQIEAGKKFREQQAAEKQAEKERLRQERDEQKEIERIAKEQAKAEQRQRQLIITRQQQPQPQQPIRGMVVDNPSHPTPTVQPASQPVVIYTQAAPQQQRLDELGWFTRAFSTTAGIMICLILIPVAFVFLACGGCLMVGILSGAAGK